MEKGNDCSLPWLAAVSCVLYAAISLFSTNFQFNEPLQLRPIPIVLAYMGLAFVVYLLALRTALRLPSTRSLLAWIVVPAIVFRLILLSSPPIQEVDIYRYLWDGAVTAEGVSPFRYSPQQVAAADTSDELPHDLARLVRRRDASRPLTKILERVHYGELPTIYPPVSQAVFAAVGRITPASAGVAARIILFKSVLLLFDLGTIGLVLACLSTAKKHLGWSIAYAWCPLVLKEFANSGHLDAIAVFFCMAGVWLTVRAARQPASPGLRNVGRFALAAAVLAVSVGAKLYPIVLTPWFLVLCFRRLGMWRSLAPLAVLIGFSILLIWPMLPAARLPAARLPAARLPTVQPGDSIDQTVFADRDDAIPRPEADHRVQDPSLGLASFIRRWEMNDFIFMLIFENLRPADAKLSVSPWFQILPERQRQGVVGTAAAKLRLGERDAAFQLARLITTMAFLVVTLWAAARMYHCDDPARWLESAFLTLAWLWLLCPTQNPWYWVWAVPLVAFARNRCWLALSGLALLYYFRFWFEYQWPGLPVLGTPYRGALFFDFCVTWIEFAPWFAVLAITTIYRSSSDWLGRKPSIR